MMAACIHWMDWGTPESTRANWTKWASVLKPGGTLIVTGGRPVIGPYTGEKGDQIRPLRDWLLDFPMNCPEIGEYYGDTGVVDKLRSGGLYRQLPMPWQHSPELAELWDPTSYCWIPSTTVPSSARPLPLLNSPKLTTLKHSPRYLQTSPTGSDRAFVAPLTATIRAEIWSSQ